MLLEAVVCFLVWISVGQKCVSNQAYVQQYDFRGYPVLTGFTATSVVFIFIRGDKGETEPAAASLEPS